MLELLGISKRFPGVTALDGVSVAFAPGEIHALLGENGAGKSTLIKIVTGIEAPDEGEIRHRGERVVFRSYRDSLAHGIGIVPQEIQVVPESSIAENIMLDKMVARGPLGIVDWGAVNAQARAALVRVGLDLPPATRIGGLTAAQKQLVQIAKALAANVGVLLLDEPTSCLTAHEASRLFGILRELRARGLILVFISHKLEEVFALCDRVSVLRDGRLVGTRGIAGLTSPELVKMMIGRESAEPNLGRLHVDVGRELLRVENVIRAGKARGVSFALHEGEVLGLYGLLGAGRTEIARIIIGEEAMDSGAVFVRGKRARIRSLRESLYRYGIGYVPENRKEEGLTLEFSVRANIAVTVWHRLRHAVTRRISRSTEAALVRTLIRDLDIRTTGLEQRAGDLSGGNQQKVCLAKWLAADCDVLIVDEPTVGVDVGAKDQIHRLIRDFARRKGKAVVVISSDMPEIIRLSSRLLVFREQRVVGELTGVDDPSRGYDEVSHAIGRYLN
jgi:ribose transport system ATP-binding protein